MPNYVVKVSARGQAQIYESDARGSFKMIRTLGTTDKVKSGVIQGNRVALTMENGSVRVYNTDGKFLQKL